MKTPWYCCGSEGYGHPLVENYGEHCSLPSCPNKRPIANKLLPWLPWIVSVSGVAIAAAGVSAILPNPTPILFLHVLDRSESAVNDSTFRAGAEQTCGTIADVSKRNFDSSYHLLIDSISEAPYDRKLIQSKASFRQECQERFQIRQDADPNTYVCPAWETAINEISDLSGDARPIVITQVQSNEREIFCNSVLGDLTSRIQNQDGFHIIVGSTNKGPIGEGFNSDLRSFFDSSTSSDIGLRVKFIDSSNPSSCIRKIVDSVRYKEEIEESDVQC